MLRQIPNFNPMPKVFMKPYVLAFFLGLFLQSHAQFRFEGFVSSEQAGKPVYLSLVEDYRKSSGIYLNQIIRSSVVDSTGYFVFEGDNLLDQNRMYRIHLEGCTEEENKGHFNGKCEDSSSVLFIGNNQDTVQFPTSFEDQSLCSIESNNKSASLLLEMELLKEQMVLDFMDFPSETSKKLNSKKWFSRMQAFAMECNEPLVELYIFDFLTTRNSETFEYYLTDVLDNPYYSELQSRLESEYPEASFTQQYAAELSSDRQLASFGSKGSWNWTWLIIGFLVLSLILNYVLLKRNTLLRKRALEKSLNQLTKQEQKVVDHILQEHTNKEIADKLFVSVSTVKTHINNIYKKLEVSSREEIQIRFKS